MCELPVLAEGLSGIAHHRHQRAGGQLLPLEIGEELAHQRIGGGHLALVGVGGKGGAERLGRLVGGVGFVDVDPGKEGAGVAGGEPGEGALHHLATGPLGLQTRLGASGSNLVVVAIEAVGEPKAPVEHEGGHEGSRAVTAAAEMVSEGGGGGGERRGPVEADPVAGWEEPGQDRGVGGEGEGGGRPRCREPGSFSGQAVQIGGGGGWAPVRTEAIGTTGVDGDQEQVSPHRRRGWRVPRATRQQEHDEGEGVEAASTLGLAQDGTSSRWCAWCHCRGSRIAVRG